MCLGEASDLVAHRESTNYVLMANNELVAGDSEGASIDDEILSCMILMLTLKMSMRFYLNSAW